MAGYVWAIPEVIIYVRVAFVNHSYEEISKQAALEFGLSTA
jgi:hypothetical protein